MDICRHRAAKYPLSMTRVALPIVENYSTKVPNCSFEHLSRISTRDRDTLPLLWGGQIGDTVVPNAADWTGIALHTVNAIIYNVKAQHKKTVDLVEPRIELERNKMSRSHFNRTSNFMSPGSYQTRGSRNWST